MPPPAGRPGSAAAGVPVVDEGAVAEPGAAPGTRAGSSVGSSARIASSTAAGSGSPRPSAANGAATIARHGTAHMAAIGRAGSRTTIARRGVAFFRGIVRAKGWAGPRRPELVADLAGGRWLADVAA